MINRNMRCIEIGGFWCTLTLTRTINRNMRCIEITLLILRLQRFSEINRNMRCIEMALKQNGFHSAIRLIET